VAKEHRHALPKGFGLDGYRIKSMLVLKTPTTSSLPRKEGTKRWSQSTRGRQVKHIGPWYVT